MKTGSETGKAQIGSWCEFSHGNGWTRVYIVGTDENGNIVAHDKNGVLISLNVRRTSFRKTTKPETLLRNYVNENGWESLSGCVKLETTDEPKWSVKIQSYGTESEIVKKTVAMHDMSKLMYLIDGANTCCVENNKGDERLWIHKIYQEYRRIDDINDDINNE